MLTNLNIKVEQRDLDKFNNWLKINNVTEERLSILFKKWVDSLIYPDLNEITGIKLDVNVVDKPDRDGIPFDEVPVAGPPEPIGKFIFNDVKCEEIKEPVLITVVDEETIETKPEKKPKTRPLKVK